MSVCRICRAEATEPGICGVCLDTLMELTPGKNEEDTCFWVPLLTVSFEPEAYLIHGLLQGLGIPCVIESMKYHAEPVNLGLMSEIRLLVAVKSLDWYYEHLPREEPGGEPSLAHWAPAW